MKMWTGYVFLRMYMTTQSLQCTIFVWYTDCISHSYRS